MRRLHRPLLPGTVERRLSTYQQRIDAGDPVQQTWNQARRTMAISREVTRILRHMAGQRERCFFCEDSRGTDIEHFWPKTPYPERAFSWPNLLLACTGCNRLKGDRFPLDKNGSPLLIDPSSDNPWDHLFLDTDTGYPVARWHANTGQQDPKGLTTTNGSLLPLNIEALTEGRLRTIRRLRRAVQSFLKEGRQERDIMDASATLFAAIKDNDDYGISHWFFCGDGQTEPPFDELRKGFPKIYSDIEKLLLGDPHSN